MSQFWQGVTAGSLPDTVVETITGNDGVAEAAVAHNFNLLTAHTTVKFLGSAATETLDFGLTPFNLMLGSSGPSITSASSNTAYGFFSGNALTTGSGNVFSGVSSGLSVTSGVLNTYIGSSAASFATGSQNTAIGSNTYNIAGTTGSLNTIIGSGSGSGVRGTDSNNLVIASEGTAGTSNSIHIGTQSGGSAHTTCFIAGISGVAVPGSPVMVTMNPATGQLGNAAIPVGGVTSITGTANQVIASSSTGAITLSTPQSIATTSDVTFNSATITTTTTTANLALGYTSGAGNLVDSGTASIYGFTDTSSARTMTLATPFKAGRIVVVKDQSGGAATNNITVSVSGGANIDTIATFVINTNFGSATFYDTGSAYFVM